MYPYCKVLPNKQTQAHWKNVPLPTFENSKHIPKHKNHCIFQQINKSFIKKTKASVDLLFFFWKYCNFY